MFRRAALCGLILPVFASTGCYDWVPVDPVDAQKLSGSFVTRVGPNTVAIRVVDVKEPDGRVAELSGDFDVQVRLKTGELYKFEHPVEVEADGDALTFRGGNRPAMRTARADIASLEASQRSTGKTVGLTLGISLAAAAIFLAVEATTLNK